MKESKKERKEIGLAVVGSGTVGRIRSMLAKDYPGVGWLGVCDIHESLAKKLAEDTQADFWTTDYRELLKRSEVNASIIATDENAHVDPILASVERGHRMLIEKPLATDVRESRKVYNAIQESGVDAVIGYTSRFRRRFLTIKEKLRTGEIGDVTTVTTRAFMNRLVPIPTLARTKRKANLTPMVNSGTHALDMSMWLMEGKEPAELYARSIDKVLGPIGTKDAEFGIFTMTDGTLWSMNISWALPEVWPAAVYTMEIGIVGTKGVITIDDTHRDLVIASEKPQWSGYRPAGYKPDFERHVEFLTSYPPGDVYKGQFWGPMREETNTWFTRIYCGIDTPHATAWDGHRNLVLTMAMNLSANRGVPIKFPLDEEEFYR